MNIYKSLTFWSLLLSGLFLCAQWIPFTGVILMMMQAHVFAGILPHLIVCAILFDFFAFRAPKTLFILPFLPYCLYFYYYSSEQENISNIETAIRDANPSEIITYDPDKHALLSSDIGTSYKVPVTFSVNNNFPQGYMSQRIATQELCQEARNNEEWQRAFPVNWYKYGKGGYRKQFKNICRFEMPEAPTKQLLRVETKEDKAKGEKLQKEVYSFYLDDQPIGEYTAATYAALPSFPIFAIGCFLNSAAPSWDCFFNIAREKRILNVFPADAGFNTKDDSIVAQLLGIEKYSERELRNFTDYPETKEILGAIIARKENETSADFDKWGLRKDGPYQPKLGMKDGYPSYEGGVYQGSKGGSFKSFIKEHEGGIIYLDIDAKPNANTRLFSNWAVCEIGEKCNSRTDNYYVFQNKDGTPHNFEKKGLFKGFFFVGREVLSEGPDQDTRTVLTILSQDDLDKE